MDWRRLSHVDDVSSFFLFEATGDSDDAADLNPSITEGCFSPTTPIAIDNDEDDAESCNWDACGGYSCVTTNNSSVDNGLHVIQGHGSHNNLLQSTACEFEGDNEENGDEEDKDYWSCCRKMGTVLMASDADSRSVKQKIDRGLGDGGAAGLIHGDEMSEVEKNKMFWDNCLGVGSEMDD